MAKSSLGARGRRLFEALTCGDDVPEARLVLAEEAGRLADRLDELDRVIAGKGVLRLMRFRLTELGPDEDLRGLSVDVRFDSVLAEARQQANTLRQALIALGLEPAKAAPSVKSSGKSAAELTPIEEARRRRAARGAGS